MNNNNNRGSNRRRGRGNNRQQGGNQGNRIDSRARGNAPQLLEKYRKLAHDASLNGDRVQAEYYLQFADHYFRVLADSRVQKDDPRGPRRDDERDSSPDQYDRFDDPSTRGDDQGQRNDRPDRDRSNDDDRQDREPAERGRSDQGDEGDAFEPSENPFTREGRGRRPDGDRPRQPRRASSNDDEANGPAGERANEGASEAPGELGDEGPRLDPSLLPPSFASGERVEKPRRKPRKPRAADDGDKGDEQLETVS